MKKITLTVFFIFSFSLSCAASDFTETTLDTPEEIIPPATKYVLQSFHWYRDKIVGNYNKIDDSGNILDQVECEIEDADFVQLHDSVIAQAKVGQMYRKVIALAVTTKCKTLLGVTGTDE